MNNTGLGVRSVMRTSNSKKKAKRKARTPTTDLTPFTLRQSKEEGGEEDDGIKEEQSDWDCVGTHSSWQKARRSTSSGKMLWRDCEGVLSYQQNAAWSIFTRALRSLPASGRGNTANEEG